MFVVHVMSTETTLAFLIIGLSISLGWFVPCCVAALLSKCKESISSCWCKMFSLLPFDYQLRS